MKDFSEKVTWLPITKNNQELCSFEDISPSKEERIVFMNFSLKKGIYDINYVIMLLKIINDKCEKMKMTPRDLHFTLSQSIQRLLAMLEVEREQM